VALPSVEDGKDQIETEPTSTALPSENSPPFWSNETLNHLFDKKPDGQHPLDLRRLWLDKAPFILWALDDRGIFTVWAGQGLNALNLSAKEVIGRSLSDVYVDSPQFIIENQRALAGETFTSKMHLGNRIWEVRYKPVWGQPGSVAGAVAVAVDITERNEEEAALRERAAQLEGLWQVSLELAAELDLNALLESLVLRAVQLLNADAGLLYIHRPELEKLELIVNLHVPNLPLGRKLSRGEGLSGRVWQTGEPILVEDYGRWEGHLAEVNEEHFSVAGVPIQWRDELLGVLNVGLARTGNPAEIDPELLRLFAAQVAVAIHNAGLHQQAQTYAVELEQRVNARTQELVTTNERLQEMDRLKSKLIDDISHELRTPVTSIGLYLDLLERGDEGRQPYYVQVLHKQKERLATLIEGIIKISRLHVMNTPTNFSTVNLNEVVGQLLETQTFHAQAVGLPLHFTPTSDLPAVKGDSQQLSDVIINLIGNAIQYTPTGEINVRTYFDDERVYLAVEDTGTGIGENELPYIFERFYRGEEIAQLNKPGIGLGLTIAREIITFHGGDIEVTSEPGEGSTFCVWLPRL
jgi:PAS domain S-box-containing protein